MDLRWGGNPPLCFSSWKGQLLPDWEGGDLKLHLLKC